MGEKNIYKKMAFPFNKQNSHGRYNKTFLQSSTVSLKFNKLGDEDYTSSLVDSLYGYFKDVFNLDKPQQNFFEQGLSIVNQENDFYFSIDADSASLRLGRKKYASFLESMMFHLTKMKLLVFGVLNRNDVFDLEVRKVNLFGIKASCDEDVLAEHVSIFKSALSKDLVDRPFDNTYEAKSSNIVGKLQERILCDEEQHIKVVIRTAIAKMINRPGMYNIVLDTAASYTDGRLVEEGSLDRDLIVLNNVLYDTYHWCVSKEIISFMNS